MEVKTESNQTLPVITRLYEAAFHGKTNSLTILLQQDPLILDRCIVERSSQYTQSPLHVAANMGRLEFTRMLLELKPELAEVVDQLKNWSPLHMAAAKGHLQLIQALFDAKPQMSFACDRDGRTPVHVAVVNGQVGALTWFCQTQPLAVRERTAGGESVFHLCVKYNQHTALEVLVEMTNLNGNTVLHLAVHSKQTQILQVLQKRLEIGENFMNNKEKHNNSGGFSQARQLEALVSLVGLTGNDGDQLVKSEDNNGNTILHLAVISKQSEMVKYLLGLSIIEKNAMNKKEMTAVDIHREQSRNGNGDENIEQSLYQAHAKPAKEALNLHVENKWLDGQRSALKPLMVVASLIATMAFQAGINLPGGVSQESKNNQHIINDDEGKEVSAGVALWSYIIPEICTILYK